MAPLPHRPERVVRHFFLLVGLAFTLLSTADGQESGEKRRQFLKRLIPLLSLERDDRGADKQIWMEHRSWKEWQEKTGELPPDFDALPASADLPDPLILREDGKEVPVTTPEQWDRQREFFKYHLQRWVYGTMPPPPGNVRAKTLKTVREGTSTVRSVLLEFGPDHAEAAVCLL